MSTKRKAPADQLIDSLLDDESTQAPERDPPRQIESGDVTFSDLSLDIGEASRAAPVAAGGAKPAPPPPPLATRSNDISFSMPPESTAPEASAGESARAEGSALPGDPKTMVLPPPDAEPRDNTIDLASRRGSAISTVDPKTRTELRPQDPSLFAPARKPSPAMGSGQAMSPSEAVLKQSENLRIAQSRITDLEREVERVRRENERLASAGDALRRRADELLARAESAEGQSREHNKARDEEGKVFRSQLSAKDREAAEGRAKIEELEHRLDVNFKKIRVREQQLEHRLEIAKMESATLAGVKDKMILDLKRQIDQLAHESENAKAKSQELYNTFRSKQEMTRKVVRALRLALMMLEGEDNSSNKPD